jgi:hypothetical protein
MKPKGRLQDVRIRNVSVELVRRLKAALVANGEESLSEWFTMTAASTSAAYENRMKHGSRT